MGKIPFGILGPVYGKAGNIVGYVLNGQHIVKAVPAKTTKPMTKPRKTSCGRISEISEFFSPMKTFLRVAFSPAARGTTENWYNLAMKYNNPHVVKGAFPNLEIDYPKAVLSMGPLEKPVNPLVTLLDDQVTFNWEVVEADKWLEGEAMLMVYFPETNAAVYKISGMRRDVGEDSVTINQKQKNMMMVAYMTFVSSDRQTFSDSVYVGTIIPEGAQTAFKKVKVTEVKKEVEIVVSGPGVKKKEKNAEKAPSVLKMDKSALPMDDLEAAAYQKTLAVAYNFKKMGIPLLDIAVGTGLPLAIIEGL